MCLLLVRAHCAFDDCWYFGFETVLDMFRTLFATVLGHLRRDFGTRLEQSRCAVW